MRLLRLRRRTSAERESSLDLLIAGLGNPGRGYERTRHNLGWLVADELARRHGGSFRSKFSGRLAETRVDDLRLALLKPETYMNESGRSLGAAARFFKVEPASVPGSPATTGCARLRRRSARRTSCACGSASDGPGAAIGAASPTTCCRRS